jgi:hypothetical protein
MGGVKYIKEEVRWQNLGKKSGAKTTEKERTDGFAGNSLGHRVVKNLNPGTGYGWV